MNCANELTALNNKKKDLEADNAKYQTKLDTFDQKVKELTEKLENYNKEIDTQLKAVDELDTEIKKLEKKAKLSEYFYKLLGSKGELRPFLLNKDIHHSGLFPQKFPSHQFLDLIPILIH